MDLFLSIVRWSVVALGLVMASGTVISQLRSPHWFVRGWDFPRVQITTLLFVSAGSYALFFMHGGAWEWAFLGVCAAAVLWQGYRIVPYLPLAPTSVDRAEGQGGDARFRLVASNVLQENDAYEQWSEAVRAADPDAFLAVEVTEAWDEHIAESFGEDYPYAVRQPQENYYGMVMYSRLELIDPEVRFLVEDDAPSIHARVRLRDGSVIRLHGVHPRPPEPLRGEDATARDAEVVIVGREIDAEGEPTVIAGDFNDVAWSHTSELFLRVSQLLDPRKGRGFFNTFDARYPLVRWPLDHVFHSNEFKLVSLKLLPFVGSDHFPVCITLSHEPAAPAEQPEPQKSESDEEEAQRKVNRAAGETGADVMENEGAHPQEETTSPADAEGEAKEDGTRAVPQP